MLTNKRHLTAIMKAVRRNQDKITLTDTWRQIHELYGVGTKLGTSTLLLTTADHQTLLALVRKDMSLDPLRHSTAALEGDRLALAAISRNEKVSGRTVGEGLVLVAQPSGRVLLPSGDYQHPRGGTLNVQASDLHGLERVLLVENLSVMLAAHRYQLPAELQDVPMLFRGDRQWSPKAVSAARVGITDLISFPDYDPQGLMNSLTAGASAVVVPAPATIARILEARLNKPADFDRQSSAVAWLERRGCSIAADLLCRRLAISQESMADQALELMTLPS
ncbi:DUF7281 domain-containing protein [Pseudomonas aeruginosa]|uniref:DUF7281 domain-containing protein n=1 Tax=Pseudomonas aeruginosa TaxID=287 RepID=UPI00053E77ED|nr:hypothetical protein [Pseudomonas aeruginosa]HCE0605660.1 hypothetical protein [Pseudomonas aeruginosa]HCG0413714.1 hypothetical protein [Pseudomonas aeruginosa]HCG0453125.1 hypothetical protein [Pseudomonas aeruginosa]